MGLLDVLFGNKNKKIENFMSRNAIIIDVRTKGEFQMGAIPASKNIPLQSIHSRLNDIKKLKRPVITCCASGMRSGTAASILNSQGIEAMNGGGWRSLNQHIA